MIDEQAIQCGYCYNGIIIKATELLQQNPEPDTDTIKQHMNGHLCRCGTYPKIISAIQRAAAVMKNGGGAA
jgi:aerobic-type carbon monoxide dehydrogenase small subunit (CoxS/CutS family)